MSNARGPALLSVAVMPRTVADRERLTDGLRKLLAEDPALRVESGPTSAVVVFATGELHLEIVIDRLKREFKLFGYSVDLRERTHGRGTFTTKFDHYEPVRPDDECDAGGNPLVGAPRRSPPMPRGFGVALPAPDEDDQIKRRD